MAASPGKLLFGKALLCAVSVVKAGHVQDGAATSRVQREISVFYGYERAFLANRFVTFLFEEMILPHLKSSILVVFCKLNCRWSLFRRKHCILG